MEVLEALVKITSTLPNLALRLNIYLVLVMSWSMCMNQTILRSQTSHNVSRAPVLWYARKLKPLPILSQTAMELPPYILVEHLHVAKVTVCYALAILALASKTLLLQTQESQATAVIQETPAAAVPQESPATSTTTSLTRPVRPLTSTCPTFSIFSNTNLAVVSTALSSMAMMAPPRALLTTSKSAGSTLTETPKIPNIGKFALSPGIKLANLHLLKVSNFCFYSFEHLMVNLIT